MIKRNRHPVIFLLAVIFLAGWAVVARFMTIDSGFRVAIFKEEGFPYVATPKGLSAEWLREHLEDEYDVTYLNIEGLKDNASFNVDKLDLLILPYGEAVPKEALPQIIKFVKDGGGLFTTAGRPFGSIFKKGPDGVWRRTDSKVLRKYLSTLGINSYIIYKRDIAHVKAIEDIFDMGSEIKRPLRNQYGICVKTSERIYNIPPTKGNVFPFRIPARRSLSPLILTDKEGNFIGAPLVLVKGWSNPYKTRECIPNKWCLVGLRGETHPFNPKDRASAQRLKDIMMYLSTKVIIASVRTDLACYRKGEPVKITARVLNCGPRSENAEIVISVMADKKVLMEERAEVFIRAKEERDISITWEPRAFHSDFYEVKAVLSIDGRIADNEKNAFTVWQPERLKGGYGLGRLNIKEKYFYEKDRPLYLHGINYYESRTGGFMWVRPNILDIKNDIESMSAFGINYLRTHYHHPKWFRDYVKLADLPLFDYLDELSDDYLPDERSLRILDAFIVLCGKYGLYFNPDLFTLVPEEMGDPMGWIGDLGRCVDPKRIEAQKEFIMVLSERYRDVPNIIWDLWNEPFLDAEGAVFLKDWVKEIKDCFRSGGDNHLITLGSDESIALKDELDFVCGHGHDVDIPELNTPFVMQEVWNESDLSPAKEAMQAEELEKDFTACIEQGGAGFAPWQWTRQSCLWDDASEPERWDNELGLCVREDGSLKPAGRLYRDLIRKAQ